jgi:two-component system OmpR family sensor kinase
MLQMARAEAGLGHSRELTDLAAIAALVVDDFRQQSNVGARLRFDADDDQACWVAMDQDAVAIVFRNVIENAVHHGRDGEPIEVHVGRDRTVRVVNAGDALPQAELGKLMARFHRGDARQASGSGLGLTIVDMIMRQAGGRLVLASPAQGRADGFEAVIEFPRAV